MTGMRFVWRCVGVALWAVAGVWTFSTVGEAGPYDCGTSFSPDRTVEPDEDADPDVVDEDLDREAFLRECEADLATERFRITMVAVAGTAALALGGSSVARDDVGSDDA